jgi:hypothetical protein
MPRKFSQAYIDRLLAGTDYGGLVDLLSMVRASRKFNFDLPGYGIPQPLFLFVEMLGWTAQSIRSGTWTYFESTPQARQQVMLEALREAAPEGFAVWYEQGMLHWQKVERMAAVDQWLEANEDLAIAWLWKVAKNNREMLLEFGAS